MRGSSSLSTSPPLQELHFFLQSSESDSSGFRLMTFNEVLTMMKSQQVEMNQQKELNCKCKKKFSSFSTFKNIFVIISVFETSRN